MNYYMMNKTKNVFRMDNVLFLVEIEKNIEKFFHIYSIKRCRNEC